MTLKGTIVFKGELTAASDSKEVAIKRITKGFQEVDLLVDEEIKVLQSVSHDNVVRYHRKEEDKDFVFIVLELCECTLCEFVGHRNVQDVIEPSGERTLGWMLMKGMVEGLAHLHQVCREGGSGGGV